MNTKPLVSLLIANYNNGKFITETLLSAVNQTYSEIEIIVVDDASDDNSLEIIQMFIKQYPQFNIHLYRNYTNHGCGRVKRKCVDIVRGEYFAFLDPEDTIEPTAVEELLEFHLKHLKYSVVYSTHFLCNEKLEPQSISTWPGKIPEGQSHLTSTTGHISAFALCSKKDYDRTLGINPEYIVAEDQDLYLKMEEIAAVLYVDKPLYYYRKHDNNISWNDTKQRQNFYWYHQAELAAYKRRRKAHTQAVNYTRIQFHKKLLNYYLQSAKFEKNNKKYTQSLRYYLNALMYSYTYFF